MRAAKGMSGRRARWVAAGLAGVAALATLGQVGSAGAAGQVGFAAPTYVDKVRAGGEPGIIHSTKFGDLVYTAHEGTTHLDREGFAGNSIVQFLCPGLTTADCYKNHVWIWTSDDHGASWQLRDEGLRYTGFSDPDLSEDASGSIYNTGIDLANDSVFSSQDGGKTWPHGNPQCHEGDRPWLAGGKAGELFMTTDTDTGGGHQLFHSSDFGDSCSGTGISDNGTVGGNTNYSGFGKLVYDRFDGSVIEPAVFHHADGTVGVGISRLANAAAAFSGGSQTFQPVEVAHPTSVYSPFGAPLLISMDSGENIYFAWDTDERDHNGTGGCNTAQSQPLVGGGPTPLPNHIMFVAGKHVGPGQWQFSAPISLASQGNARVLWPWSVAGTAGNVSVVWYQMDRMVDPDCDLYNGQPVPGVKTFIYEAHIGNATGPGRQITVTNASGRAIHEGGICDSGTTCVATGQDRRLGDYFTNSIDANGCVIIASGDTTVLDPASGGLRATSLPIFIQQNRGSGLTGKDCRPAAAGSVGATTAATSLPNTATGPNRGLLPLTALAVIPLLSWYRRRRR